MRKCVVGFVLAACAAFQLAAPAAAQFVPGDIYVASWKGTSSVIHRVDPSTWTVTTFTDKAASGIDGPSALCWVPSDRLLVSCYNNDTVYSFDSAANGTAQWKASDGLSGPFGETGLTATLGGDVLVSNFDSKQVLRFAAGGGAPTVYVDASDGVVHADGIIFDACNRLFVANREGFNVLCVDVAGNATVFDTLPDHPMAVATRNNGDLYVACLYGDVYRYPGGVAAARQLFLSFQKKLSSPSLRFANHYRTLYFTSLDKGNLLEVDADTAAFTEVVPPGTLGAPLGLEVVGERVDIGFHSYGHGTPGTGDLTPSLSATGHPVFGWSFTLELRDFVGGAVAGVVVASGPDDRAGFGGWIGIDVNYPLTFFTLLLPGNPGVAGEGDLDLTYTVPSDSTLDCFKAYLQVIAIDPAGANGYALSNAQSITLRSF